MTRSFHGKTFLLDEHLARLEQSCQLLEIPLTYSRDDLRKVCDEIVERNAPAFAADDEHRLMIVASPGCAPMYAGFPGVIAEPWVYVMDFPLRYTVRGMGTYYSEGVRCRTSPIRQVNDSAIPSSAKHRSRLHFYRAQETEPLRRWPLLLDQDGRYCEAVGANLILCRNGLLRYLRHNALFGISMLKTWGLAAAMDTNYPHGLNDWNQGKLKDWLSWWQNQEHCKQWDAVDEVLLSATPFCLLPVVEVDDIQIGTGKPGPIYRRLLSAWSESVNLDIAAQVQRWDSQG